MKSPAELKSSLRMKWESADIREMRLLNASQFWPWSIAIGKPSGASMLRDLDQVKAKVEMWRRVDVGDVIWHSLRFRATGDSVQLPVQWRLNRPTEWIDAIEDESVSQQFEKLATLVEKTDRIYHRLWVRRRSVWRDRSIEEIVKAARIASSLSPGCGMGRSLRMIAREGMDTKFLEVNSGLMTLLLDERYDGEVSQIGLAGFLGSYSEKEHWVLLVDLDGRLLPTKRMRIMASDLTNTAIPCKNVLIVENETCQHSLPSLEGTIAVLGCGLDLQWTKGEWLQPLRIGYWGDIDSWGLKALGIARRNLPQLQALLMSEEVFCRFTARSVVEKVHAGESPPPGLSDEESRLYQSLIQLDQGRLEQEYLPEAVVHETLRDWLGVQDQEPSAL